MANRRVLFSPARDVVNGRLRRHLVDSTGNLIARWGDVYDGTDVQRGRIGTRAGPSQYRKDDLVLFSVEGDAQVEIERVIDAQKALLVQVNEAQESHRALEKETLKMTNRYERDSMELEQLRDENALLNRERNAASKKMLDLQDQCNIVIQERAQLKTECTALQKQQGFLDRKHNAAMLDLQEQCNIVIQERAQLKTECTALQKQQDSDRKKLQDLQRECNILVDKAAVETVVPKEYSNIGVFIQS